MRQAMKTLAVFAVISGVWFLIAGCLYLMDAKDGGPAILLANPDCTGPTSDQCAGARFWYSYWWLLPTMLFCIGMAVAGGVWWAFSGDPSDDSEPPLAFLDDSEPSR